MKAKNKQHFIDSWMNSMMGQRFGLLLQSDQPQRHRELMDAAEKLVRTIIEEIADEQGFED